MPKRSKTSARKKAAPKTAALTKRVVVRAASKAIRMASSRAMKSEGFVVKADNGWVVRSHADGRIEKLKRIHSAKRSTGIVLD